MIFHISFDVAIAKKIVLNKQNLFEQGHFSTLLFSRLIIIPYDMSHAINSGLIFYASCIRFVCVSCYGNEQLDIAKFFFTLNEVCA